MPSHSIAVFGASGRTGRLVVEQAGQRGHRVIAVCRVPPEGLFRTAVVLSADLEDPARIQHALGGASTVVCAFGPRNNNDIFCARDTVNIITAMRELSIHRLACITGAMIGCYPAQRTWAMSCAASLFARTHPAAAQDRADQEQAIFESDLDWTVFKPPRLIDRPTPERVELGEHLRVGLLSRVSRAALASAIVDSIESQRHLRARLFIRAVG
jgi:putative NADH-flavin reductase